MDNDKDEKIKKLEEEVRVLKLKRSRDYQELEQIYQKLEKGKARVEDINNKEKSILILNDYFKEIFGCDWTNKTNQHKIFEFLKSMKDLQMKDFTGNEIPTKIYYDTTTEILCFKDETCSFAFEKIKKSLAFYDLYKNINSKFVNLVYAFVIALLKSFFPEEEEEAKRVLQLFDDKFQEIYENFYPSRFFEIDDARFHCKIRDFPLEEFIQSTESAKILSKFFSSETLETPK